jgi:hypothetical protein
MASCIREKGGAVSVGRRALQKLPPSLRLATLHALGRYAPWEPQFDFTPPALGPGEVAGPPDFVGIGVQKAGTTWWYGLLAAHPDVSSRPDIHKERHFFDRFATAAFTSAEIARYHGWFPRRPRTLAGEWTPDYFSSPWVAPLLAQAAPQAKLLLLLRDPVERFRSGLDHAARSGRAASGSVIVDTVERGYYDRALTQWLEHFDPGQLLVLQYERCTVDPVGALATTFRFLGLPDAAMPAESQARSGGPGHALDDDARARLVEIYAPDVAALCARCPEIDVALWPNFAYLADAVSSSRGPRGEGSSPTRR